MKYETISIVVPVYNNELYLSQCIESILNQTYRDIEVILVDDGSTDSSGKICDQYAQIDYRIKVIHQKNQGSQVARSIGIENANGEYIGFVDSDDWIDNNMFENLYKYIGTSDLVTSGLWSYDKNGIKSKWVDLFKPGKYNCQNQFFLDNLILYSEKSINGHISGLLNNLVCKLFRKSIVKECYTKANVGIRNGEDLLFTLMYVFACKEITVSYDCYYHYRYNATSITHSKNLEYLNDMIRLYQTLEKEINGHIFEKKLKTQLKKYFLYFIHDSVDSLMQADADICYPKFIFPKSTLLYGKKIVLFGAGKVGNSFYNNWKDNYNINIVKWIDNIPSINETIGCEISKPEIITLLDFDYVVCAVIEQNQAEKMKNQLLNYGVKEEQILWMPPENVFWKSFIQ